MTTTKAMRMITTYIENDRTFFICECNDGTERDGFWAFEDKYIESDTGRLLKQFNGITGFHNKTYRETVAAVSRQIKIDALVASGMDLMQAAMKVCMTER